MTVEGRLKHKLFISHFQPVVNVVFMQHNCRLCLTVNRCLLDATMTAKIESFRPKYDFSLTSSQTTIQTCSLYVVLVCMDLLF